MRVMVVCTTGGSQRWQFGGVEHFLIDMLPALAEAGIDIVPCTPDDAVAAALREAGLPWINLGARSRIDLDYVRRIRRLLPEVRPDVVDAHMLSAAMHCRAALGVEGRRTPLIVTLHNSLWQYRAAATTLRAKAKLQSNIALDLLLRRLRPHMTVAVSEFEANELRTKGRVRRLRLVPNPLPRAWPEPRPRTVHNGPVRVGFLGRLEPEKGADLLGDIARARPDAVFRIAGSGTVRVPELPNVELLGQVDAARFLPELDCLVVPSRVESFGKSAQEALSLGVPVVHTGAGGLAELTRPADGVLGFTTDGDPASIAEAIRKATAPERATGERLALARWYQQEYGFPRAVERWAEVYRAVSNGDG